MSWRLLLEFQENRLDVQELAQDIQESFQDVDEFFLNVVCGCVDLDPRSPGVASRLVGGFSRPVTFVALSLAVVANCIEVDGRALGIVAARVDVVCGRVDVVCGRGAALVYASAFFTCRICVIESRDASACSAIRSSALRSRRHSSRLMFPSTIA